MNKKYIEILFDDVEQKKEFNAKWATECDVCSEPIEEDGVFYFFGDKQKVCLDCKEKISEMLQELNE